MFQHLATEEKPIKHLVGFIIIIAACIKIYNRIVYVNIGKAELLKSSDGSSTTLTESSQVK